MEFAELMISVIWICLAWINDDKQREQKYREALKSCNPNELIGIIKNMYFRKQKRSAQGKRSTVVDERYFRMAEDALYSELAFAIGREKDEMQEIIAERLSKE